LTLVEWLKERGAHRVGHANQPVDINVQAVSSFKLADRRRLRVAPRLCGGGRGCCGGGGGDGGGNMSVFDMILGTDLLYCVDVVYPLLRSVSQLLGNKNSVFVLVSSFDIGEVRLYTLLYILLYGYC
jgi:hypothetical protein